MNEKGIKRDVIVIGASAGGVSALLNLCQQLPADLPAAVGVVLHRSPWHRVDLAELYGRRALIRVREAVSDDPLEKGTVYFAPPDHHLLFRATRMELSRGPKVHFCRPAVDVLFTSAAASFGDRVAGILLTGGGTDGAHGLVKIKERGGLTIVQKPEQAAHPMMPLSGIREDSPDGVVSLEALPDILSALAEGRPITLESGNLPADKPSNNKEAAIDSSIR